MHFTDIALVLLVGSNIFTTCMWLYFRSENKDLAEGVRWDAERRATDEQIEICRKDISQGNDVLWREVSKQSEKLDEIVASMKVTESNLSSCCTRIGNKK
jgi:hypothetical protein